MNDLAIRETLNVADSEGNESALVYNDYDRSKRVLTSLVDELKHCSEFCFSVAFITHGGLSCLKQHLINSQATVHGRIITTDYLNFNEPKALRDLLRFPNIDVRMYTSQGFHTKGYLFDKTNETSLLIGSSNLTQDALNKTKEWNVRLSSRDGNTELIRQTREEFERMWEDAEPLTEQWINDYEPRHIKARVERDRMLYRDHPEVIKPNSMQLDAMQNLARLRSSGQDKALLISATGTGKTYLSAFDVKESGARKVLFLVHREQILDDARRSYQDILGPSIRTGKITGQQKDYDADFIFSTTISMSKDYVREHFSPDHFDYIICDEAHHTAASSYNKILEYFRPRFLLGMTATPERMDGADIFEKFNHNIAYEIRLQDALQKEMLCPFHYFGITDIDVDGMPLDDEEDFNSLTSDERVRHIIEKAELYGYSGDRVKGLIFCRNKEEGRVISRKMNLLGPLRTRFICDEDNAEAREDAVRRLEKDEGDDCLDYIITVDIFNEGVDIKSVNQVIMLRPTKSATIFIQQLGRGLRKMTRDNRTKEYLVVIDFIGNYQNNFMIPVALTGDSSMNKEHLKKHLMISNEGIPGCSTVDFDLISKERIYESINRTTGLAKMMRDTYKTLVNVLGYCPDLRYLYRSKKIDPEVLVDHYGNLNEFKRKLKLDFNGYSEPENRLLTFVSTNLIDGMRPHELLILRSLLDEGTISLHELDMQLGRFSVEPDDETLQCALSVLDGTFSDELSGDSLISIVRDEIHPSGFLASCITNGELRDDLVDVVECGLEKFDEEYREGFDGAFTPFKRYSRADVVRLLNWKSKNDSSTVYGYRVKNNTCPMFVTYRKDDSISKSTQYEDRFIDRSTFSWMTRNNVRIDGTEVTKILSPECRSFLFVKKDDDDSTDFFYMGQAYPIREKVRQTTITNDKGKQLPIVNIPFRLSQPVPQGIYDYIVGE